MGLFKKSSPVNDTTKDRRTNSGQPLPRTTIHHHHNGPSPVGIAIAITIGVGVLAAGLWYAGIFLLRQMAVRHPAEAWAAILLGTPLLLALNWLFNTEVDRRDASRQAHAEKMKLLELETLRLQRTMQPALLNPSKVNGDNRLAELIMLIMTQAYKYLEQRGRFRGQARPWSRRQGGAFVLTALGESKEVGGDLAVKAKSFLLFHDIITPDDEQINTARYPDIDAVRMLLALPASPMLASGQSAGEDVYSLIEN